MTMIIMIIVIMIMIIMIIIMILLIIMITIMITIICVCSYYIYIYIYIYTYYVHIHPIISSCWQQVVPPVPQPPGALLRGERAIAELQRAEAACTRRWAAMSQDGQGLQREGGESPAKWWSFIVYYHAYNIYIYNYIYIYYVYIYIY